MKRICNECITVEFALCYPVPLRCIIVLFFFTKAVDSSDVLVFCLTSCFAAEERTPRSCWRIEALCDPNRDSLCESDIKAWLCRCCCCSSRRQRITNRLFMALRAGHFEAKMKKKKSAASCGFVRCYPLRFLQAVLNHGEWRKFW